LIGKQTPFKATMDFNPVIVRKRHELAPRPRRQQRIPPKFKRKRYGLRQLPGLVKLEPMSGRAS
jgi:hypothetical protein